MSTSPKKHILCLAFPAFGHLIPLLELGKKISKYHHVTFAVTIGLKDELQNRELYVKSPQNDLEFAFLEDGLTVEEFNKYNPDTHFSVFETIIKRISPVATTFLKSVVDRTSVVSSAQPVDVVIIDSMFPAPLEALSATGMPFYLFNTANCNMALGAAMMNETVPVCEEPEDGDVFLRPVAPGAPQPPVARMLKELFLGMKHYMPLSRGIIVNSFQELEADVLAVLTSFPLMEGIHVSCVGPMFPEENEDKPGKRTETEKVKKWLDGQAEKSVLYMSFGSFAVPAPEQLYELGKSLLLLNKPVVFSLRTCFHESLPKEFVEAAAAQTVNNRFLMLPWSPQKLILRHPATAVFVSHCGWNSTLESMCGGVPIIGWPLFADQLMNAEAIASHGMGRVVQGTGVKPERVVMADEIINVIGEVAGWGNKQKYESSFAVAAKSWKDKIQIALGTNGSSETEFQQLVKFEA